MRRAHRNQTRVYDFRAMVRTAHPTAASPKLLLRFSLQSGAYEHESCACSRDPGEKCGLMALTYAENALFYSKSVIARYEAICCNARYSKTATSLSLLAITLLQSFYAPLNYGSDQRNSLNKLTSPWKKTY